MSVEIKIEGNQSITTSPSETLSTVLRRHGIDIAKHEVFTRINVSNETEIGTNPIIVKKLIQTTAGTPEENLPK